MRDLISSKRYLLLRADEIDCNRGQQRKALAPGPGIPRQPRPQELGTVGHKAIGEHTGTNTPELRTWRGMKTWPTCKDWPDWLLPSDEVGDTLWVLRVPICKSFRLMPPSWFLRFWTDQAYLG